MWVVAEVIKQDGNVNASDVRYLRHICVVFDVWLGWAYLTKKMPHAATMPIVTAVVCFLSTQNMGS